MIIQISKIIIQQKKKKLNNKINNTYPVMKIMKISQVVMIILLEILKHKIKKKKKIKPIIKIKRSEINLINEKIFKKIIIDYMFVNK